METLTEVTRLAFQFNVLFNITLMSVVLLLLLLFLFYYYTLMKFEQLVKSLLLKL